MVARLNLKGVDGRGPPGVERILGTVCGLAVVLLEPARRRANKEAIAGCQCNFRANVRGNHLSHTTHGSFLVRRQRGHPGVVLPPVIYDSANH